MKDGRVPELADEHGSAPSGVLEANAIGPPPPEAAGGPGPSAWIGRVLGDRYRIDSILGQGGMGWVFEAEHLALKKRVAVKVIRAELAENREISARFVREAMATACFEHPHITSAIDYGVLEGGAAYLVMQRVRGHTLRQICGGQPLPWRRACELLAQVADALSAAKSAGIIHRDLKPDNILVEEREDGSDLVKVLDFGLACFVADSAMPVGAADPALTRIGTVMGTPAYLPPEQVIGEPVDHRSDLYTLGVLLWECIAGRALWEGPDPLTLIMVRLKKPVPLLRSLNIDKTLPRELDALVQQLTACSPAQRPEHAAEVRDSLRRLARLQEAPRLPTKPLWESTARFAAVIAARLERGLSQLRSQAVRLRAAPFLSRALLLTRGLGHKAHASRAGLAAVGLCLVFTLGAVAMLRHQRSQNVVRTAPAETAAAHDSAQPAQPEQHDRSGMLTRLAQSAKTLVATATEPPVPEGLAAAVNRMLEASSFRERRSGALEVRRYHPAERVPAYLLLIADFEIARSCKNRAEIIVKMKDSGDRRFVKPLEHMGHAPTSGCGFLGMSDCYACVRKELEDALGTLNAEATHADDSSRP